MHRTGFCQRLGAAMPDEALTLFAHGLTGSGLVRQRTCFFRHEGTPHLSEAQGLAPPPPPIWAGYNRAHCDKQGDGTDVWRKEPKSHPHDSFLASGSCSPCAHSSRREIPMNLINVLHSDFFQTEPLPNAPMNLSEAQGIQASKGRRPERVTARLLERRGLGPKGCKGSGQRCFSAAHLLRGARRGQRALARPPWWPAAAAAPTALGRGHDAAHGICTARTEALSGLRRAAGCVPCHRRLVARGT